MTNGVRPGAERDGRRTGGPAWRAAKGLSTAALIGGLGLGLAQAWAQTASPSATPAPLTPAAPVEAAAVGWVKTLNGPVHAVRQGKPVALALGSALLREDRVVCGPGAAVGMSLVDDSVLTLGASSQIELSDIRFDSTTHEGRVWLRLLTGTLHMVTGWVAKQAPQNVRLQTPTAVLGVRGTRFIVDAAQAVAQP